MEADLSSTSVMKKKTETSLSVFLSFSLNFQKDAILNPGEERIDWFGILQTCNGNPIQEKKKGLIVLEFSRHMQWKSNPGEEERIDCFGVLQTHAMQMQSRRKRNSCSQTTNCFLFPENYYILCGEALKTNKSVEPSRNMDPAFFFVTTLRLIAQKSISTTKQFKGKQTL